MGLVIEDYENTHFVEPDGDPIAALRYLMEEHELEPGDLEEVATEPHIYELLQGKRQFTLEQIVALSQRFHVSPGVFMDVGGKLGE